MAGGDFALVTGGAGYIGGHVALALADAGWRIAVLDDLSAGSEAALLPDAVFYRGDSGDAALLDKIFTAHNIGAVMHLAAVASVPDSFADPARCERVNCRNSAVLIEAAKRHGAPVFIFSSTSVVYDENGAPPFAEDSALAPISPYAASKLKTEHHLAANAGAMKYAVLRYFNVGGVDARQRAGNYKRRDTTLIKSALECAGGKRQYLEIFGGDYPTPDGTCVRDYIHVSDIARGHMAALEYLRRGGASDIFNLGLGRGFSVREVIEVAKEVSGVDFAVRESPRRAGDPAMIYGATEKAERVLGFRPAVTDLRQIVADSWAWETRGK